MSCGDVNVAKSVLVMEGSWLSKGHCSFYFFYFLVDHGYIKWNNKTATVSWWT